MTEDLERMKHENQILAGNCEELRRQLNLTAIQSEEMKESVNCLTQTLAAKEYEIANYREMFDKAKCEKSVITATA